jgi:hypothetical protein
MLTPSVDDESSARDKLGRLTGEVIKTVQGAIKQGFHDWSPRLLLAMYSCEIQASSRFTPPIHAQETQLTTPQPKSLAVSTTCSPAAADASSPNP